MSLDYGLRRFAEGMGLGTMNHRIYGMPYNYTDITDPGSRAFNKTMFSNMAVLYITPGRPEVTGNVAGFLKGIANFSGLGEGGAGYTSFTIASPTGEGLTTAFTFSRERRMALVNSLRMV